MRPAVGAGRHTGVEGAAGAAGSPGGRPWGTAWPGPARAGGAKDPRTVRHRAVRGNSRGTAVGRCREERRGARGRGRRIGGGRLPCRSSGRWRGAVGQEGVRGGVVRRARVGRSGAGVGAQRAKSVASSASAASAMPGGCGLIRSCATAGGSFAVSSERGLGGKAGGRHGGRSRSGSGAGSGSGGGAGQQVEEQVNPFRLAADGDVLDGVGGSGVCPQGGHDFRCLPGRGLPGGLFAA